MPRKSEKVKINHYFLDKRVKLIPCKKEMIHYWFAKGISITEISKMFGVNKRLIQFELFPERKLKNLSDREDRGGSGIYYNREKNNKSIKKHRDYKDKLYKNGVIK